jgi:hypothetical protein
VVWILGAVVIFMLLAALPLVGRSRRDRADSPAMASEVFNERVGALPLFFLIAAIVMTFLLVAFVFMAFTHPPS